MVCGFAALMESGTQLIHGVVKRLGGYSNLYLRCSRHSICPFCFGVHAEGVFVHWFEARRIQDCTFLSLKKLLEKFDEHCVEQEGLGDFYWDISGSLFHSLT